MNFKSATLIDYMNYLEDLDYEASISNKSTSDLLQKAKLNKKISTEVFNILNNTLQAMKKGEITCNGNRVTPYEVEENKSNYLQFAIDLNDAFNPKSIKELNGWFDSLDDWDITHFNDNGTEFESTSHNSDKFFVKKDKIKVGSDEYILHVSFTHLVHIEEQGIYLLKKVDDHLEGVTMIRWKKDD